MSVKYASLRPYPATPGTSPPALPLPPNHQLPYNFQYGVIPPPPGELTEPAAGLVRRLLTGRAKTIYSAHPAASPGRLAGTVRVRPSDRRAAEGTDAASLSTRRVGRPIAPPPPSLPGAGWAAVQHRPRRAQLRLLTAGSCSGPRLVSQCRGTIGQRIVA